MMDARTLHSTFAAQAAATPDRIAVCCGNDQITYGELDRRSSQLAQTLRSYRLPAESRIGLCLERGIDMIAALIGVLKSGCAYVPIDPAYPLERIRYIVDDGGLALLISSSRTAHLVEACDVPVLQVDTTPDGVPDVEASDVERAAPSDRALAYVIYTSGSTGRPKGVMVEHRSVLRLIEELRPVCGLVADDVWTCYHSIAFDFSVWEIWGSLLTGARLVMIPAAIARAPERFAAEIDAHRVTVLNLTPTAFSRFSPAYIRSGRTPTTLRLIIFGGEMLSNASLIPWARQFGLGAPMLINMYGITETTVHATWHRVSPQQLHAPESFIGRSVGHLTLHLLDDDLQPVAQSVPGRIYLSGDGLARGYLNRPALTAERFLESLATSNRPRLYDSGDLAAEHETGALVYLGRADDQIKLHGFRIEPREIERCLEQHESVASAVVVAETIEDEVTGLVAYIVLRDHATATIGAADPIVRALAAKAQRELPNHMRPCEIRVVDYLPMTANGKVDRRALRGSVMTGGIA
jgi:amino acid adenylation domain-containing protein